MARIWLALFFVGFATAHILAKREEPFPDHARLADDCPGYNGRHGVSHSHGMRMNLQLAGEICNIYGTDLSELRLEATYETEHRLHVVIEDSSRWAYQVPKTAVKGPSHSRVRSEESGLQFSYTEEPFSFAVSRSNTGEVLFNSSAAGLVFESQYIRLRTSLPDDPYLYGLGEHADPFRLNTTGYMRTLWNRDARGAPAGENLYGSHPFYLEHRETGSHGVFLLNSNGMDILIDKDEYGKQFLEYNTLGGILDFYFFDGPSPVDVVRQYSDVMGTPKMAPYWGLGFQQSKVGYQDVYEVAEVVRNYSLASIPLETMWTDVDYQNQSRAFTLDEDRFPREMMRELVDHLHLHDQKYVMMVDPAVAHVDKPKKNYPAYGRGRRSHAFLRNENGSVWLGMSSPGVAAFPDWFSKGATGYWIGEFKRFFGHDHGVDVDGVGIDNNEPSNSCDFPCADPFAAVASNPPPEPPALRPWPRLMPGWPCSFQPNWSYPAECMEEGGRELAPLPGYIDDDDVDDSQWYYYDPEQESSAGTQDDQPLDEELQPVQQADNQSLPTLTRRTGIYKGSKHGFPARDLLYPPYAIHNKAAYVDAWNGAPWGGLSNHTIPNNITNRQFNFSQHDTHNLYGLMMGRASRKAMIARRSERRPFVLSRSTFAGAGTQVGHWLPGTSSSWTSYRHSMRALLGFTSLYQFSLAGADVCGFNGDATEELCARWAALGAFSPLYRNHYARDSAPQEFYRWPAVAASARRSIATRYRLLDYMYTTMWRASFDGSPSLYPTFYLYPGDRNTWELEHQYFYGPALLVAPVTQQGATSVDAYLPDALFYDWYTHEPIQGRGAMHTFTDLDLTDIPLLMRAGVIIPVRLSAAPTTTELRTYGFEIVIPVGTDGIAGGELYLDNGDSLHGKGTQAMFAYEDGVLRIDGEFHYKSDVSIQKITLVGAAAAGLLGYREKDHSLVDGVVEKGEGDDEDDGDGVERRTVSFEVDIRLNKASNTTVAMNRVDGELAMHG